MTRGRSKTQNYLRCISVVSPHDCYPGEYEKQTLSLYHVLLASELALLFQSQFWEPYVDDGLHLINKV